MAGILALVIVVSAGAMLLLGASSPRIPPPEPARMASWGQWAHVPGVLDVVGPRRDGRLLAAANGRLEEVTTGGVLSGFARTYAVDPGAEAYIALSPGLKMSSPSCAFPSESTYALRLQAPSGVTVIDRNGEPGVFATTPIIDALDGLAFDVTGRFGHRLLVTGTRGTSSVLAGIDCLGQVAIVSDHAPHVEGGLAVAPASFGAFGGYLVGADEVSGRIIAMDPTGTGTELASPRIPIGPDTGVESVAFIPPGFIENGNGYAYVADRGTPGNPHPGTDSILRVSAPELARAGVADGDLLVVTEGGSLTISLRCSKTCETRRVASGPATAHGEGHLAFTPG